MLVSRLLNLGSLVIIICIQRVARIVRYQTLDLTPFGEILTYIIEPTETSAKLV